VIRYLNKKQNGIQSNRQLAISLKAKAAYESQNGTRAIAYQIASRIFARDRWWTIV
jgi:hypothetical protein